MEIKTGRQLQEYLKHKLENKYTRKYRDLIFNEMNHSSYFYVLYGTRRIGKTIICFQILQKFIDNKIYQWDEVGFIDIELSIALGLDSLIIKNSILQLIKEQKVKLLFLDEIQLLDKWDMFLKSINDHYSNIKIIASGSSSYGLKESESGVGRFFKCQILPLTIKEFIEIRKININEYSKQALIDLYLKETAFFELWNIKDEDNRSKYMINILEKTISNDLSLIANRSYTHVYFKQILREIALSETGELSFDNFQKWYSIPKTTFYEYLNLLESIGIITVLNRYNKNLSLSKRGPNKYYLKIPFFYLLYLNDNIFHQGKIYESLFLLHFEIKNNVSNISNRVGYIKDKDGEIDFYFIDQNMAYELKSNSISYSKLYLELSNSKLELKTIDINELFDMLYEFNL